MAIADKQAQSLPGRFLGLPWEVWLLAGLIVLSLILNFWFIDGQTYHPDEYKKVLTVSIGKQSFQHPQLMRRLLSFWAWNADTKDFYKVMVLGRWMTAMTGTLLVVTTYVLSRRYLGMFYGFLCALAMAVSPMIVIHSHYLKEDILLTLCLLLSLGCLAQFLEKRNVTALLALGVMTGLTISSHYKGVLLAPIYLALPLFIRVENKKEYFLNILGVLLLAFVTFFVVNNLFVHYKHFVQGATYEFKHSVRGHKIVIDGWSQGFLFHLKNSLVPGTSFLMTLLGLAGLGYCLLRWKTLKTFEQLLILTGLAFYAIHEISPNKPFPDYMRYMIPVVPMMFYTACKGIQAFFGWLLPRYGKLAIVTQAAFPVVILMMLATTVPVLQNMEDDTRARAKIWCAQALTRNLTCQELVVKEPGDLDINTFRQAGVTHILMTSDLYERYLFVRHLKNQPQRIYQIISKVETLLQYPHFEIKPAFKSFAFSNPTVRIIDIRPDVLPND